jgi:hypothetical protein
MSNKSKLRTLGDAVLYRLQPPPPAEKKTDYPELVARAKLVGDRWRQTDLDGRLLH